VGTGTNGELINDGFSDICTYILRYSDVLLIYAESVLAAGSSTTDGSALDAMNQVRARAGLGGVTEITKDNILHERRVEFAFEGDYWYDIQRQGFEKAKEIIAGQERGSYNFDGSINSIHASIVSPGQLFLPIPLTEVQANPKLSEDAIKYY
jgi:starch-binding outer membrane protein, SusD/RagB family